MAKRDQRGRFVNGTAPGPGRPKKKPLKHKNIPLWNYQMLREAWITFRLAQKYNQLGVLRCRCGNDDPQMFDYELASGKLRARCKKCGFWNDFREKHAWYAEPLPGNLTKEEQRLVKLQREGKI
ncbi:MAG: hypothetical protein QXY07_04555 [Candidatus Bathyarchaeia archaeon]